MTGYLVSLLMGLFAGAAYGPDQIRFPAGGYSVTCHYANRNPTRAQRLASLSFLPEPFPETILIITRWSKTIPAIYRVTRPNRC